MIKNKDSTNIVALNSEISSNLNIAEQFIRDGNFNDAETYLQMALESGEEKSLIYNHLGGIYFNRSEYDKAEKHFLEAIKYEPDMVNIYFNIGMLYQKQGKFIEALPYYKVVVEADPEDAEVYYFMGQCAQSSEMIQEAEAFFKESFRLSPMPKTALDLGILYITQEDYNEAEKMLGYIIDTLSNDKTNEELILTDEMESLHFTMGILLKKQNKHEDAMKSFYNAIMINDQNEQAYNYLGECCIELGLNQEAESFFSKASKLDPNYLQPILNIGKLYFLQNKFYNVVLAMEQLFDVQKKINDTEIQESSINKEIELAYNLLGKAYLQLGDQEKAKKAFESSLMINSDQPEIDSLINSSSTPSYKRTILSLDD